MAIILTLLRTRCQLSKFDCRPNCQLSIQMSRSEADADPENELHFRAQAIQTALRTSLRVADLRCSLFVAALLTYRRPTCLKPFPPAYVCDGSRQYDILVICFFDFFFVFISVLSKYRVYEIMVFCCYFWVRIT